MNGNKLWEVVPSPRVTTCFSRVVLGPNRSLYALLCDGTLFVARDSTR